MFLWWNRKIGFPHAKTKRKSCFPNKTVKSNFLLKSHIRFSRQNVNPIFSLKLKFSFLPKITKSKLCQNRIIRISPKPQNLISFFQNKKITFPIKTAKLCFCQKHKIDFFFGENAKSFLTTFIIRSLAKKWKCVFFFPKPTKKGFLEKHKLKFSHQNKESGFFCYIRKIRFSAKTTKSKVSVII